MEQPAQSAPASPDHSAESQSTLLVELVKHSCETSEDIYRYLISECKKADSPIVRALTPGLEEFEAAAKMTFGDNFPNVELQDLLIVFRGELPKGWHKEHIIPLRNILSRIEKSWKDLINVRFQVSVEVMATCDLSGKNPVVEAVPISTDELETKVAKIREAIEQFFEEISRNAQTLEDSAQALSPVRTLNEDELEVNAERIEFILQEVDQLEQTAQVDGGGGLLLPKGAIHTLGCEIRNLEPQSQRELLSIFWCDIFGDHRDLEAAGVLITAAGKFGISYSHLNNLFRKDRSALGLLSAKRILYAVIGEKYQQRDNGAKETEVLVGASDLLDEPEEEETTPEAIEDHTDTDEQKDAPFVDDLISLIESYLEDGISQEEAVALDDLIQADLTDEGRTIFATKISEKLDTDLESALGLILDPLNLLFPKLGLEVNEAEAEAEAESDDANEETEAGNELPWGKFLNSDGSIKAGKKKMITRLTTCIVKHVKQEKILAEIAKELLSLVGLKADDIQISSLFMKKANVTISKQFASKLLAVKNGRCDASVLTAILRVCERHKCDVETVLKKFA